MTGEWKVAKLTSFWRKCKGSQSSCYVIYHLLTRVKNTDYRSKLNKSNCSVDRFLFLWMSLIYDLMELHHVIESHEKLLLMKMSKFTIRYFPLQVFSWPGLAGSVRSPWIWSKNIRWTSIPSNSSTNYFWLYPLPLDRDLKSHKKLLLYICC